MSTIRMPGGMGAWLQPRAAIQQMEDDIHREAVRRLVVNTCYEIIRDCDEPELRVEAAQLLAQVVDDNYPGRSTTTILAGP